MFSRVPNIACNTYYFLLTKRTNDWKRVIEKDADAGKIEGQRRRGWQRMRWLGIITDSMDINLRKFWEIVKDREAWHAVVHGVAKSRTQLSEWRTMLRAPNYLLAFSDQSFYSTTVTFQLSCSWVTFPADFFTIIIHGRFLPLSFLSSFLFLLPT